MAAKKQSIAHPHHSQIKMFVLIQQFWISLAITEQRTLPCFLCLGLCFSGYLV